MRVYYLFIRHMEVKGSEKDFGVAGGIGSLKLNVYIAPNYLCKVL